MQDYIWITVSFFLFMFIAFASIGLTFIRFDRLIVDVDGVKCRNISHAGHDREGIFVADWRGERYSTHCARV